MYLVMASIPKKMSRKRKEKVIPFGIRELIQQKTPRWYVETMLGAGILEGIVEYFIKGIISLSISFIVS